MFSIMGEESRERRGTISRRELLRVGGISSLGLFTPALSWAREQSNAGQQKKKESSPPRANACVFIFLFGGPSHIDLWDMKPSAPLEIRGEFRPIATSVPGIQLCEHLPRLAARMDKFCLVRSMTHHMPVHGPACSEIYSGRPYFGPPTTDQAKPEDWPSIASMVTRYGSRGSGSPSSIVLPWYTQFVGQDKPIAGQTGGRMGTTYRPFLIHGDPSRPDFQVPGLRLPKDVPMARAQLRRTLLSQMESAAGSGSPRLGSNDSIFAGNRSTAHAMLNDTRTAHALELNREPEAVRSAYGESKFAQSLLLARRLVEAGTPLITVNWDDESRDEKVSPFWDTHNHNFPSLKNRLAPRFDRAFSAFLDDLDHLGLLESTLVVVSGEFGRTPRIGQFTQNNMTEKTGRDHWPHAFTVLMAGGGVRGGQVYGSTNEFGAYVKDNPVTPADLSATVLHHLGIDPNREYWDEFQQVQRRLSEGNPIKTLG